MNATLESALSLPARSLARSARARRRCAVAAATMCACSCPTGPERVAHTTFADLPRHLARGDLIVVNTSATVPAAVAATTPDGRRDPRSTSRPSCRAGCGSSRPASPSATRRRHSTTTSPATSTLAGGGHLASARTLRRLAPALDRGAASARHRARPPVAATASRSATGTRPDPWPLSAYQQIFGAEPGSAEMPSASRPFTPEIVVDLVRHGVTIAPILLHTGVSSLEGNEMPYPERYRVPAIDREPRERGARRRRTGRRRRHDRRARPRDRRRRSRRRASRTVDGPSSS